MTGEFDRRLDLKSDAEVENVADMDLGINPVVISRRSGRLELAAASHEHEFLKLEFGADALLRVA
jgi:hypothetical protein